MSHAEQAEPIYDLTMYADQSHHSVLQLHEGWTGSYISSVYSKSSDEVQILYCAANNKSRYQRSDCHALNSEPLTLDQLTELQEPLVKTIQLQSARLQKKLEGANIFLKAVRGKPEDNSNVQGLNQMIEEINSKGIGKWILVEQNPNLGITPTIENPSVMEDLAASISDVFNRQLKN